MTEQQLIEKILAKSNEIESMHVEVRSQTDPAQAFRLLDRRDMLQLELNQLQLELLEAQKAEIARIEANAKKYS